MKLQLDSYNMKLYQTYNLSICDEVKWIINSSVDCAVKILYAVVQLLIGNKRKHSPNTRQEQIMLITNS